MFKNRFMDDSKDSSDDEASSNEDKDKKKKNKKKEKSDEKKKEKDKDKDADKKKKKKKHKKSESSEESSSSSSESEEEHKEKDKTKAKTNGKIKEAENNKTSAPTQSKLSKITAMPKQNKSKPEPPSSTKKEAKIDNSNILEMDFGFENSEPSNQSQDANQEWANISAAASKQKEDSNDLFNAFNSKQSSAKTDDLIKSLGDLYSQTPQPQYSQFPQYPQAYPAGYPQAYSQPSIPSAGYPPSYGGYPGYPTQYVAPAKPTTIPATNYDDPFASVIEEQQKKQNEELQKAQAAKFMQQTIPTAPGSYTQPTTGMTPNMFFQQMMSFMQNASGQSNPSQNAMMMAAMQQMMAQMSVNNQATAPKQEPQESLLETSAPDPNKAMFKSLFTNATSSTFSEPEPSGFSFKSSTSTTSPYAQFTAPTPAPVTRHSEPSNPFGTFGGTPAPSTSQSSGLFDTQFTNSGFKSGGKLCWISLFFAQ